MSGTNEAKDGTAQEPARGTKPQERPEGEAQAASKASPPDPMKPQEGTLLPPEGKPPIAEGKTADSARPAVPVEESENPAPLEVRKAAAAAAAKAEGARKAGAVPAEGARGAAEAAPTAKEERLEPVPAEQVRALLTEMAKQPVAAADPVLGKVIDRLVIEADKPNRLDDPMIRTRVAYALQDIEKATGALAVDPPLREEMTRLAGAMPGLVNERLQSMLRDTGTVDNRKYVTDLRRAAQEVAGQADQDTPDIRSRVDALEGRSRVVLRIPTPGAAQAGASSAGPETARPAASANAGPAMPTSPGAAAIKAAEAPALSLQERQLRGGGLTMQIMRSTEPQAPEGAPPWDRQLTPLSGVLAKYGQKVAETRERNDVERAEKSGQAAVDALQAIGAGPGAATMAKIKAAADTHPEGMAGVMAEMREGGTFAGLRREFNSSLAQEKVLAGALDKAGAAVARYGVERGAVQATAEGKGEARAMTARFAALDAQVGAAAAEVPGRKDGTSQLDELGEKARELIEKAVEKVKKAFSKAPGTGPQASSGPSPSP